MHGKPTGTQTSKHHWRSSNGMADGLYFSTIVVIMCLIFINISGMNTISVNFNKDVNINGTWSSLASSLIDRVTKVRGRRYLTVDDLKVPCQSLPRELLRKILGPAYNPRYMSFDKPEAPSEVPEPSKFHNKDQNWQQQQSRHRHSARLKIEAFHVHEGFTRILHQEPVFLDGYSSYLREFDVEPENQRKGHTSATPPTATTISSSETITADYDTWTLHPIKSTRKQQEKISKDQRHHRKHERHYFKEDEFEQVEPTPIEVTEDTVILPGAYKFLRSIKNSRSKRNVKNGFPWACDSKIEWLDLGPNHFPRFLRSVVCTSDKCWFGHFQCRPKAFTVKILRRRKDSCVVHSSLTSSDVVKQGILNIGGTGGDDLNSHVPAEFREQWTFEERAVTFCCECAA